MCERRRDHRHPAARRARRSPARPCASTSASRAARTPVRRAVHNPRAWAVGRRVESGSAALVAAASRPGHRRRPGWLGCASRHRSCGTYGMKATHGLVPYTGIMPIELTIDHCGPDQRQRQRQRADARSARRPDGLDPRQHAGRGSQPYTELMKGGVKGCASESSAKVSAGQLDAGSMPSFARPPNASSNSARRWPRSRCRCTAWAGDLAAVAAKGQPADDEGQRPWFNWKGLYVTSMVDWHAVEGAS